jgi:outer membrane protein
MSFKFAFSFVLALCLGAANLQAQTPAPKYGHMNLGNLLDELPATKKADDQLKLLADRLATQGDSMAKVFQTAYAKLEKDYNEGLLTPVQAAERQEALQKQQAEIQAFEQDAQKQIDSKRNELLQPILDEIQKAIKEVAKENGYLMIFDVSSGAMLFAEDSDDISALVKKKLGIQ